MVRVPDGPPPTTPEDEALNIELEPGETWEEAMKRILFPDREEKSEE